MAVGIYLFFREKNRKTGILLILAVLLDHGLWDSFLSDSDLGTAILSAALFILFVAVYERTLNSPEDDMRKINSLL